MKFTLSLAKTSFFLVFPYFVTNVVSLLSESTMLKNKESVTTFISENNFNIPNVISQFFPKCDIYLSDDNTSTAEEPFTEILTSSTATVKLVTPFLILHLSSYFQQRNWNSTRCSHISCFPLSPRRHSHCSLAIGLFFQGTEKLVQFNQLLFSPYEAPLKNERDHAIFLTGPEVDMDSFLQHKELSTVKFKLGISLEQEKDVDGGFVSRGKSNCFFCADGQYEIMNIDVSPDNLKVIRDLFPDYTKNGYGHTLKASGPTKYPFLYELEHVGNDKWKSKRGVYHFALLALLPHFNFTFSVYPSRNGGSGTHFENGSWDGVIGDMVYSRADFGTAASSNPERYLIVSFTNFPISYIYVTFMMGPPRKTYTWKAIYWPFAPDLWLGVAASIGIVIFIFKIMDRTYSVNRGQSIYRHLFENISFALLGQGYDCAEPEAHAARLLLAVWLFATIILNTLYVSQVVGLLAFPLYQIQPFTFKSLVESDFKWGFDRSGGSLFAHFKLSTNQIFPQIFEGKLSEQDAIDCFNLAVKTDFACITWSGVADYTAYKNMTLKHGKSPLVFANEKTQFIPSGIMLPRRSLHKDNFNSILGMLTDSGQDDKWLSMDYENLRKAKVQWQHSLGMKGDDDVADEEDLLSLSNLLGIFYIYIVGHIVSLFVFLWEKIKVNMELRKRKKMQHQMLSKSPARIYEKKETLLNFIGTMICGVGLSVMVDIKDLSASNVSSSDHDQQNVEKNSTNEVNSLKQTHFQFWNTVRRRDPLVAHDNKDKSSGRFSLFQISEKLKFYKKPPTPSQHLTSPLKAKA